MLGRLALGGSCLCLLSGRRAGRSRAESCRQLRLCRPRGHGPRGACARGLVRVLIHVWSLVYRQPVTRAAALETELQ